MKFEGTRNRSSAPEGKRLGSQLRARRHRRLALSSALLQGLALLFVQAARADTEATTSDGRRVLLKDDGRWQYAEEKDKDKADDKAKDETPATPKQEGQAVLRLVRRVEHGNVCGVVLSLQNKLPYEIVSIVPLLSAYRANGVLYQTVSIAFQSLRPTAEQESTAEFSGIPCSEIERIQVNGGDRCAMGELNKFSDAKGQCLARVAVAASELVRFDK